MKIRPFIVSLLVGSLPLVALEVFPLNTSHPGKLREYKELLEPYGFEVEATEIDLPEIDATPEQVVAHKASSVPPGVWVEDTSLEVEGADVGVNVRWLLHHLTEFEGRSATWVVLLARQVGDDVHIFRGATSGTLVHPRNDGGIGFDALFLPDGEEQTLGESKPTALNARAKAIEAAMNGELWALEPPITLWDGPWQQH